MKQQLLSIRAKTKEICDHRAYEVPTGVIVIEGKKERCKSKTQAQKN